MASLMEEDERAPAHRALGESSPIKDSPGEADSAPSHFAAPEQGRDGDPPRLVPPARLPALTGPSPLLAVWNVRINLVGDPIILKKDGEERPYNPNNPSLPVPRGAGCCVLDQDFGEIRGAV